MQIDVLKQRQVAVWGYGVEGQATVAYLNKNCPELALTVLCPSDEIPRGPLSNTTFDSTEVTAHGLNAFDVVIKSPGITPYQPAVEQTTAQIISSAALWFSNERSGKIIAVTGTKGKSTTCAMLVSVLQAMGHRTVLAGNFGVPLIQCVDQYDYVVLETSSYQAQDGSIQADIAVLLNLYSEHLNWHLSESQYHLDKWCLLQQADHAILNAKDDHSMAWLKQQPLTAEVSYFADPNGYYVLKDVLMYQDKALISKYGWRLKGAHNLLNAAAVCTVMAVLSADPKVTVNALKSFEALPHRLETVGEIAGVTYINDSISSTPHATWAALTTVEPKRTILLVGGFDRGVDWGWWVDQIKAQPPKMIICSGQNGEKIHQLILNHGVTTQCIYQDALKAAVKTAKHAAIPGDCVLLSPGAPSFDAFNDYQQRGLKFSQWIN